MIEKLKYAIMIIIEAIVATTFCLSFMMLFGLGFYLLDLEISKFNAIVWAIFCIITSLFLTVKLQEL